MKKTNNKSYKSFFNVYFISVLFWTIVIFIVGYSNVYSEDKVLWLLVSSLGFHYSVFKWDEFMKRRKENDNLD